MSDTPEDSVPSPSPAPVPPRKSGVWKIGLSILAAGLLIAVGGFGAILLTDSGGKSGNADSASSDRSHASSSNHRNGPHCSERLARRLLADDDPDLDVSDSDCIDLVGNDDDELVMQVTDEGVDEAYEWRMYSVSDTHGWKQAYKRTVPDEIVGLEGADKPNDGDLVEFTRQPGDNYDKEPPPRYRRYHFAKPDAPDVAIDVRCHYQEVGVVRKQAGLPQDGEGGTCADINADGYFDVLLTTLSSRGKVESWDWYLGTDHGWDPAPDLTITPTGDEAPSFHAVTSPLLITMGTYQGGAARAFSRDEYYQVNDDEFEQLDDSDGEAFFDDIHECPDRNTNDLNFALTIRGAGCDVADKVVAAHQDWYEIWVDNPDGLQPVVSAEGDDFECLTTATIYEGATYHCANDDVDVWYETGT